MKETIKDPQATKRYSWDFSDVLTEFVEEGEALETAAWSVSGPDNALTLGGGAKAPTHDSTTATCWLQGGTLGADYVVTCHITTTSGEEDDRSFRLYCRSS